MRAGGGGGGGTLNRSYLPWLGNACNVRRIQHIVSGEGFWQTGRGCNDVGQRGTREDQKRQRESEGKRERECHKTLEERKIQRWFTGGISFSSVYVQSTCDVCRRHCLKRDCVCGL